MEVQESTIKQNDVSLLPLYINNAFKEKFEESINILEQLYKKNKRWIVTYSGGKDSTALVVLSLYMKTVHPDIDLNITYADTMMEIPQMAIVAHTFLKSIEKKYPAEVKIVYPDINDTYWVRMIGRGYPPPGPRFRWCTPKIKIKPSRKLHEDSGLFITGLRMGESQQRDIRLKSSCLNGGANECGSDVWVNQKGIDVAAPIIHWSAEDVWYFLMMPGRKAVAETQLVVDLYGNTSMRFGCWMCTVVMKDKTMIALARSGDYKVKKLLEFREWIVEECKKPENRYFRKDGRKGRLNIAFREIILKRILELQSEINFNIINEDEVIAIQTLLDSGKYRDY
ncbi:phosphoadenosine phosphosulfate reductase family protein [Cuniculiplasma sp. SKW3]|uniref:phosphoadenosine phosphosulfate reductase domain-containing protein n=1 Tax=Cuniculiplasma sp. SKW3 TaxID=3400170 RepID=UPI003FD39D42